MTEFKARKAQHQDVIPQLCQWWASIARGTMHQHLAPFTPKCAPMPFQVLLERVHASVMETVTSLVPIPGAESFVRENLTVSQVRSHCCEVLYELVNVNHDIRTIQGVFTETEPQTMGQIESCCVSLPFPSTFHYREQKAEPLMPFWKWNLFRTAAVKHGVGQTNTNPPLVTPPIADEYADPPPSASRDQPQSTNPTLELGQRQSSVPEKLTDQLSEENLQQNAPPLQRVVSEVSPWPPINEGAPPLQRVISEGWGAKPDEQN